MLQELELVAAAAATKEIHPALPNLFFHDGRVQGGNGHVTVDVALPLGLDGYMVPAVRFVNAVDKCGGSPTLKIDKDVVVVAGNRLRARVPLLGGAAYPQVASPPGDGSTTVDVAPLRVVRPFVATDASRPFACALYFHDGYVYATNNVCMVRTPIDYDGPDIVIPVQCIDELLRLPFTEYCVEHTDSGLYFRPPQFDCWVHTRALELQWPTVEKFFEWDTAGAQLPEVNSDALLADVERLKSLVPDDKVPVIVITADGMRTLDGSAGSAQIGDDVQAVSAWRAEVLELVLGAATHVDFSRYPSPCPFAGPAIAGVMTGYRL